MKHIHHIVPKHMGGTDDPSNLIELSVEEHAKAHKKLYEEYGNEYDRIAYEALSGIIKKEEVIQQVLSEAGKRGAANIGRKRPDLVERNKKRKCIDKPRDDNGKFASNK